MTLHEMCLTGNYHTDKYYSEISYSHSYIENFYDNIFQDKKESIKNILEIGIWHGGSLQLWRDFFVNANVYGIDVYLPQIDSDRIWQIKGNAYSESIVDLIRDDFFDIIIDDGPHTPDSQIQFVQKYFSKLQKGGFLICEDILSPETVDNMRLALPQNCDVEVYDLRERDNRLDSIIFCARK